MNTGPVSVIAMPNRVRSGIDTVVGFTVTAANVSGGNCTLTGTGVSRTYVPSSCSIAPTTSTATLNLTQQTSYVLACPGGQYATTTINIVPKYQEF
jgi:hypothetical protein